MCLKNGLSDCETCYVINHYDAFDLFSRLSNCDSQLGHHLKITDGPRPDEPVTVVTNPCSERDVMNKHESSSAKGLDEDYLPTYPFTNDLVHSLVQKSCNSKSTEHMPEVKMPTSSNELDDKLKKRTGSVKKVIGDQGDVSTIDELISLDCMEDENKSTAVPLNHVTVAEGKNREKETKSDTVLDCSEGSKIACPKDDKVPCNEKLIDVVGEFEQIMPTKLYGDSPLITRLNMVTTMESHEEKYSSQGGNNACTENVQESCDSPTRKNFLENMEKLPDDRHLISLSEDESEHSLHESLEADSNQGVGIEVLNSDVAAKILKTNDDMLPGMSTAISANNGDGLSVVNEMGASEINPSDSDLMMKNAANKQSMVSNKTTMPTKFETSKGPSETPSPDTVWHKQMICLVRSKEGTSGSPRSKIPILLAIVSNCDYGQAKTDILNSVSQILVPGEHPSQQTLYVNNFAVEILKRVDQPYKVPSSLRFKLPSRMEPIRVKVTRRNISQNSGWSAATNSENSVIDVGQSTLSPVGNSPMLKDRSKSDPAYSGNTPSSKELNSIDSTATDSLQNEILLSNTPTTNETTNPEKITAPSTTSFYVHVNKVYNDGSSKACMISFSGDNSCDIFPLNNKTEIIRHICKSIDLTPQNERTHQVLVVGDLKIEMEVVNNPIVVDNGLNTVKAACLIKAKVSKVPTDSLLAMNLQSFSEQDADGKPKRPKLNETVDIPLNSTVPVDGLATVSKVDKNEIEIETGDDGIDTAPKTNLTEDCEIEVKESSIRPKRKRKSDWQKKKYESERLMQDSNTEKKKTTKVEKKMRNSNIEKKKTTKDEKKMRNSNTEKKKDFQDDSSVLERPSVRSGIGISALGKLQLSHPIKQMKSIEKDAVSSAQKDSQSLKKQRTIESDNNLLSVNVGNLHSVQHIQPGNKQYRVSSSTSSAAPHNLQMIPASAIPGMSSSLINGNPNMIAVPITIMKNCFGPDGKANTGSGQLKDNLFYSWSKDPVVQGHIVLSKVQVNNTVMVPAKMVTNIDLKSVGRSNVKMMSLPMVSDNIGVAKKHPIKKSLKRKISDSKKETDQPDNSSDTPIKVLCNVCHKEVDLKFPHYDCDDIGEKSASKQQADEDLAELMEVRE